MIANSDPAGDNYHYLRNPLGTQGNWNREAGEPYEDFGLDGIQGTCQAGTAATEQEARQEAIQNLAADLVSRTLEQW